MYLFRTLIVVLVALLVACSDDTLIRVEGERIGRDDFAHYLMHKNIPVSNDSQVQRALEDYARREAMAAAVRKSGKLDMNAIEAEVREFRKQILISRYFDHFLMDKVDDAAVANYYAANARNYRARKAHLAHILFRTRPEMSEQERAAKRTAAAEALSRINRGDDFAEVARSMSEDAASASRGGDLGWMVEGAVAQGFSDAAFALESGGTTGIITTTFGFHIIRLLDGPQEVSQPLDAVAGDIRYQLRQQARDAEIERLRKSVKLEVGQWQTK